MESPSKVPKVSGSSSVPCLSQNTKFNVSIATLSRVSCYDCASHPLILLLIPIHKCRQSTTFPSSHCVRHSSARPWSSRQSLFYLKQICRWSATGVRTNIHAGPRSERTSVQNWRGSEVLCKRGCDEICRLDVAVDNKWAVHLTVVRIWYS